MFLVAEHSILLPRVTRRLRPMRPLFCSLARKLTEIRDPAFFMYWQKVSPLNGAQSRAICLNLVLAMSVIYRYYFITLLINRPASLASIGFQGGGDERCGKE
jgi:hypothetical protein